MSGSFVQLNDVQAYCVSENGPELRTGQDAVDLMSAASERRATWIAIPVSRLSDDFFELRSGIAGEIAQKFAMYGAKMAIVGDISSRVATSHLLAGFVAEENRRVPGIEYNVGVSLRASRLRNCVSWPATTQPTALKLGVILVSKTAQKADFYRFSGFQLPIRQ